MNGRSETVDRDYCTWADLGARTAFRRRRANWMSGSILGRSAGTQCRVLVADDVPDPDRQIDRIPCPPSNDFTAVLSLPELVERVLEALHTEVGFDSCTIGLLDEQNSGVLTLLGAAGIRKDFRGLAVPRGMGLNWAVLETGKPLYVPDMQADPRVFRQDDRVRSGIYAPLTARGHAIGVLSAHRGQVDAFSATDLDLLTVVARYLAGAFEVARLHEQLRTLAATDPLTGLMNRRAFVDQIEAEINRSRRTDRPFAVALLDLDGFKAINDAHGHAAGDVALIRVAEVLRRGARTYDRVARFGGDEFVLFLPATTAAQAHEVLERVRSIALPLGETPEGTHLTVSWGIASWPSDGDSPEVLMGMADARLYAMKKRERE